MFNMFKFLFVRKFYSFIALMSVLESLKYIHGIPLVNKPRCICVPDQWHGILSSTEREYDLQGGQSYVTQSDMYVYYDYTNRKFATEDLNSGHIAVADYKKGFRYLMNGDECHIQDTKEKMRKMCLPESSRHQGDYTLGLDIPVEIWMFEGPMNMSMRTTVLKDSCMPLSEEVSMRQSDYESVTSSFYLNVQLGIPRKNLFDVPGHCLPIRGKKSDVMADKQLPLESVLMPGNRAI